MLRNRALPESGDLIDSKYRVVRQLGAGGMGVVFEAVHASTEGRVALKFLSPELATTPEAVERFKREARATGRIHHPNVVSVHDCGNHEGRLYLAMELLTGVSLREWLHQRPIDPTQACSIMFPVMRGVAAAHAVGVLHRDLKPDNIFLAESPDGLDPVPKVLDFGIAKVSSDVGRVTDVSAFGTIMGTYQFMAPEQLRNVGELDARVDIYALGAVLFNMLTGQLPYHADNPVDLALQILAAEACPVTEHVPTLPAGLARVVSKAMSRDRNARYLSVDEFALALEPYGGGLCYRGVGRRMQPPPPTQRPNHVSVTEAFSVRALQTPFHVSEPPPKPAQRSHTTILVSAALVMVAVLGVATYVRIHRTRDPIVVQQPSVEPNLGKIEPRVYIQPSEQLPVERSGSVRTPQQEAEPVVQEFEGASDWANPQPQGEPVAEWPSGQLPPRAKRDPKSEPTHTSEQAGSSSSRPHHTPRARPRADDATPQTTASEPSDGWERNSETPVPKSNPASGTPPVGETAEPVRRGRANSAMKFEDF